MPLVALSPHQAALKAWMEARGMTFSRAFDVREDGIRTTAYTLSPPAQPRGRIVFVHGTGNEALYPHIGLFKLLLRGGWEVQAADLDGHGRGGAGFFDPGTVRAAVPRMLERAFDGSPGPVHAVGESLGASLLLDALAHTDAPVASAVAISPPDTIRVSARIVLREVIGLPPAALRRLSRHYGWRGMVPAFGPVRRGVFPLRTTGGSGFGYLEAVRRVLEVLDLTRRADAVRVPVLLVAGLADRIADPGHAVRLHERLPRAELRLMPRRTHCAVSIDPRCDAWTIGWIERHGAGGAS